MRPRSLAEVAAVARRDARDFAHACNEFMDAFYLAHPDRHAQGAMLRDVPVVIGSPFEDAWLAAMAEHLAGRWGLAVPGWVSRTEGDALTAPAFVPPSPALRGHLLVSSPPAFRARLIFTASEPLLRARFPRDVPEVEVALPWPTASSE